MKQPLGSSGAVWTRSRAAVLVGLIAGSMAAGAKPVLVVDGDADGVSDEHDDCPYSLPGEAVDGHGCGIAGDADADGVSDAADLCPYTDDRAVADSDGCALDDDFDGIANGLDLCPTPALGERDDRRGCEPGSTVPGKPANRSTAQASPRTATPPSSAPVARPVTPAPKPAPAQLQAPAAAPTVARAPSAPPAPAQLSAPAPASSPTPAIDASTPAPQPHVPGAVEVAESLAEIGFDAHSATLTAAARGRVLALAAEVQPRLASMPGTMLRLAGHYHIEEKSILEGLRSAAIRDALVAAGIPASRIRIDAVSDARRRDGSGRRVSVQFLMTR